MDRWIFSTDGVGFPVRVDDASIAVPPRKRWVTSGAVKHPAMLGIGPGIEQNTHKIGECVDLREVVDAVALLARFPSAFVAMAGRAETTAGLDDPRRGALEAVHDRPAEAAAGNREDEQLAPAPARAQRGEETAGDLLGGRTEERVLCFGKREERLSGKERALRVRLRVGEQGRSFLERE